MSTTTTTSVLSNLKELENAPISIVQEALKNEKCFLKQEQRVILWQKCLEASFPPAVPVKPKPLNNVQTSEELITKHLQLFPQILSNISIQDVTKGLLQLCADLGVDYRIELLLLLLPFIYTKFPLATCFQLESLLIRKYIPFLLQAQDEPITKCMGLLFRLILQYHDPELGLFFKSSKYSPSLFVQSWMSSWFVSSCFAPILTNLQKEQPKDQSMQKEESNPGEQNQSIEQQENSSQPTNQQSSNSSQPTNQQSSNTSQPTNQQVQPSDQQTSLSTNVKDQLPLDSICEMWDLFLVCDASIHLGPSAAMDHVTLPLFICIHWLMKHRTQFIQQETSIDIASIYHDILSQRFTTWTFYQDIQEAKLVQKETPMSAKNQIFGMLYSTSESQIQEWTNQFEQHVVLPVPTSEIIERFKKNNLTKDSIQYMIIDCRALKSYQFARLPTAIHIGAVGYDKQKMNAVLERFEKAKGSHFVIYGTGKHLPDEDNLLNVIAMRFVVAQFPHISFAPHGFKDCIKYITHQEIEFVRDVPLTPKQEEAQVTSDKAYRVIQQVSDVVMHADWSQEWQHLTSKVTDGSWWGSLFQSSVTTTTTSTTTSTTTIHQTTPSTIPITNPSTQPSVATHQTATTMHSTPLLTSSNEPPKSAFSLDDEDGEDDMLDTLLPSEQASVGIDETLVKLDDLKHLGDPIHVFPAHTLEKQERFIVVTPIFVICIQNHPAMQGYGIILWKRSLRGQILKLAYHKDNNKLISFVLKGNRQQVFLDVNQQTTETFQETFVMEKSLACTQSLKEYTIALKRAK